MEEQIFEEYHEPTSELKLEGVFVSTLKRNNKQIREDRARAITEDTEIFYKRKIEDLELHIRKMKMERENALDLSSKDALSLEPAKNHDPINFSQTDLDLSYQIENATLKLKISKDRFKHLFGKEI